MPEPIDIVIPFLDKGNRSNELRFCLRSIEKHLSGYGDIYIIGSLPDWAAGVKHTPLSDSRDPKKHEQNIFRKIIAGWENGASDKVLHVHADHYLLSYYTAAKFPYYTHRLLLQGAAENQGAYRTTLIRTDKLLRNMLLPVKDFDCHCPIIYERDKFLEAFAGLEWKDYGLAIKSLYCNYWEIPGEPCTDLKITGRKYGAMPGLIAGRDWFSTGNGNDVIERFLSSLFPLKSRFEK